MAVVAYARPADAAGTTSIDLHANVIDYYGNRFIITADGNVRLRLSDGTTITGDTFAMDLKLNRFVVAGNVHVDGHDIHEPAAAFASYPDLDRSYLLSETGTPDRYTYFGSDFTDQHKGREQPGDAFALPDMSDERPFIIAGHAWIVPKTSISLTGTRMYIYGAWVPMPSYVVNFSANPNYAQNGFSGAIADVGLPFAGTRESVSAFHLRYDSVRGFYTAFDQHFVFNRDYIVASVNPLTQNQRQWNFIGYKRESPAFETRLFYQLSTLSRSPFERPHDASSFQSIQLNTVFGRHAIGILADQWENDLLADAANGFTPFGLRQAGHPFDIQLSVQSFENEWRAWRSVGLPLKFTYRFGFGQYHDGYGIPTVNYSFPQNAEGKPPLWGGVVYPTIWQHFLGLSVYTPSIPIAKQWSIALHSDKQVQWYSLPHYIDTTQSSITLARTPLNLRQPAFYVSYGVTNIGDNYGRDQLTAYPPTTDTITTEFGTYTGLSAFRGYATSRSYTTSMVYTPTQYFALNINLRRFFDTPAPVAGLGGQPPWQFSGDLRLRLSKTILIDLTRSYFFNFSNNRWTPQFGIQFSP